MNKLTNILLATFVVLFLLSFGMKSEAVGACPPGSNTSLTYTINIAGCDYTFQLCYKCPFTSSPTWFSILTYHKVDQTCSNGIPMNVIKDSIANRVLEYRFFLYGLCTQTIPPCGTGSVTWVQRDYDCWYKYNDAQEGIIYYVCDVWSWCQREYEVCWTQGEGPTLSTPTSWHHVGTPYCDPQKIEPEDPPIGYASDCWFNSICGQ